MTLRCTVHIPLTVFYTALNAFSSRYAVYISPFKNLVTTTTRLLIYMLAIRHGIAWQAIKTLAGEWLSLVGESSYARQNILSGNKASRRNPKPKAEEACRHSSCIVKDCYQTLLRYRFSSTGKDAAESQFDEENGNHLCIHSTSHI